MIEYIEGVDEALADALRKLHAGRGLSYHDTMRARACLALDCLNRLKLALKDEMDSLRDHVCAVAADKMPRTDFDEAVEGCERRMKACVHNAVYAARAVGSPLMHEIPGALPELKGDAE